MTTLSAEGSVEESADEIVAMMGWWEEYGRYWDEIGAEDVTTDDEMAFGWLDVDIWQLPERSAE